jgi:hypothetical protein
MKYEQTTGKTIQQAFVEYHNANPSIYVEFEKMALRAIGAGKKKISFKMIMNVIRWEKFIQTEEPTLFTLNNEVVKFKINDAYGSRYARMFAQKYPEHVDKIELRCLRS